MGSIAFSVLPPPQILEDDVECFRVATYTEEDELAVSVCPNGFPGLVFQHHAGRSVIKNIVTQSGRVVYIPTLFMHGQVTELAVMYFKAPFTTIQVILKPYGLKTLFGLDASRLTNGSMGPDDFSGERLATQLVAASDDQERIGLFNDFLTAKLAQTFARDTLIEKSIGLIHRDVSSAVTVESVLEQLNIKVNDFHRDQVGSSYMYR